MPHGMPSDDSAALVVTAPAHLAQSTGLQRSDFVLSGVDREGSFEYFDF